MIIGFYIVGNAGLLGPVFSCEKLPGREGDDNVTECFSNGDQ